MIACHLGWTELAEGAAERIASSLGLFDGAPSAVFQSHSAVYAQRFTKFDRAQGADFPLSARRPSPRGRAGKSAAPPSTWRPVESASGRTILFAGTLDNDDELRAALSTRLRDPAALYGLALERWGEVADTRVVGAYATIVHDPAERSLRLARSPWSAPPLHYFADERGLAAASLIRTLHACGLSRELDPRKFADSMFNNLTEPEGWYRGGFEVRMGTVVVLSPRGIERRTFYDHLARREPIRLKRPQDYVEAAGALLDEAVARALRGATRPAAQLSGGLDSSNVTARVLAALPAEAGLDSYTFLPHPDFAESVPHNFYASEREKVERMAAMHPRLRAHFVDNRDRRLGDDFDRFFQAMAIAPDPMPNVAPLLDVFTSARDDGCDLMINAGKGNFNISQTGEWGFVEYLVTGRWVQLTRALRNVRHVTCGFPRRLFSFSVKPLLPLAVQRAIDNRHQRDAGPELTPLIPLRREFMDRHGMVERARAAGLWDDRPFRTSRAVAMRDIFTRGEMNGADQNLALEQIYGMPNRDVTAYRPLMEFCHAIPTDCFLHDGQERWLARELGRGRLPDEIRLERRAGMPQPDWHLRLSRQLPAIREELAAAEQDPLLAEIIDFAALRERLDTFPAEATHDLDTAWRYALTLPRAVMAARFSRFVSGRNAG